MQGLPALWAEAVGPGRRGAVPQRGWWSVPPGAGPGRGARRRAVGAPRGRRLLRKRPLCGAGAAPRRTGADRSGRAAGSALRGASEGWGRGGAKRRGGGGAVACAWPTPLWVGWTAPSRGMLGAVVLWCAAGLSPSRGRGRRRAVRAGRRRLPLAASAAAGGEASESLRGRFPGASGREGWGLRRPGAGPRRARSSGCASEVFLPPRADGRLSPLPAAPQGRSGSPPLGPLRGLLPSEGGAAARRRKAAAGVLRSQAAREKEQPVCPGCPGESQRPPGEIQA